MSNPDITAVLKSLGTVTVECEHPQQTDIHFVTCDVCQMRYARHCHDCKFQITGCVCTMKVKRDRGEE